MPHHQIIVTMSDLIRTRGWLSLIKLWRPHVRPSHLFIGPQLAFQWLNSAGKRLTISGPDML